MRFRRRFASISVAAKVDFGVLPLFFRRGNPFSVLSGDRSWGGQEDGGNQLLAAACRTAMSKCSLLPPKRDVVDPDIACSLLELVKTSILLSPETVRRFWRSSSLNAEDVLAIIEGFGSELGAREVDFLLKLFFWARNQDKHFTHLPKTFEMMISMLIRSQRLDQAQSLLEMQANGNHTPGMNDLFSEIINSNIEKGNLNTSLALYQRAKSHPKILLNDSCYKALLNRLWQMEEEGFVQTIYADMVNLGLLSSDENHVLEFIIQGLCSRDNVLEAVNLLKRVKNLGIRCPQRSIDLIADGYSRKRDFEDLLKFLKKWNQRPRTHVCHRILSTICRARGVDEAWSFMQNLETLGIFEADEQTLGIFVRWSCREGKLRDAFHFISEIYSRTLNPDPHSYNALLGALGKQGMWECLIPVLAEMKEKKIETGISTFKVVLAGLCMKRRFLEAELVLGQMADLGFLVSSPLDPVSRVFYALGLGDLQVNVKRDNGLCSSEVEFFDSLGNGLFLSTDRKLLQTRLNEILDDSIAPNFDRRIMEECGKQGGVEAALKIHEEATYMGEIISKSTYSVLLQALANSKPCKVEGALSLLHEVPDLCELLDYKSLNRLMVAFLENGVVASARMTLNVLLQRGLPVTTKSFVTVMSACRKDIDPDTFHKLLNSLRGDLGYALRFLVREKMYEKTLNFFEIVPLNSPQSMTTLCCTFVKELCGTGFTAAGFAFVEELAPLVLERSCYEHLIAGFYGERKFKKVFHVIHLMPEKYVSVSLYACMWEIIDCLLLGFSSAQRSVFSRKAVSSSSSYSSLFKVALLDGLHWIEKCQSGSHHQIYKLSGESFLPVRSILNMMLLHHCSTHDSRCSYALFCLVIKMNAQLGLSAYRSLVSLSCYNGRFHFALNLKDQMLREREISPLIIYNILIFHLFKNAKKSFVDLVLAEMKERCCDPDEVSWNFIAYGSHRCGDDKRFLDSINTMISKGMSPCRRNLRISVDYFCRHGKVENALTLSKAMETGSAALAILIRSLFLSSRLIEAESLLKKLQDKDQTSVTHACYDSLVSCLCRLGRVDAAFKLLNLMLKIDGGFPSERSYCLVLKGLLSQGAFEEALDIHAEMLGLRMQPNKCLSEIIVRELCGQRRTLDAEKLLDLMVESGQVPSRAMFQQVLDIHHRNKNLDKALKILHKMQQCGVSPEFEAHWSVITNLNSSIKDNKGENKDGRGFLSRLLLQTGF
ncbi:pentatricopeptide repeat (PPR) superfamily protein [Wolffia australiana]